MQRVICNLITMFYYRIWGSTARPLVSLQLFGVNRMLYYGAANPGNRWGRPGALEAKAT